MYVASVCLDVTYVAVVIHICCKRMFVNVSSVSDVCYSNAFMLLVLYDQTREVGTDRGGPLGHSGPCVHVGNEAGVVAPTCMRRRMRTAVAGGAGPAGAVVVARGDRQELHACAVGPAQAKWEAEARCTRPYRLASCIWGGASARVPSIGRIHSEKCVVCTVSCYVQREHITRVDRTVGTGIRTYTASGRPGGLFLIYIL
jgi:hypothetical protein